MKMQSDKMTQEEIDKIPFEKRWEWVGWAEELDKNWDTLTFDFDSFGIVDFANRVEQKTCQELEHDALLLIEKFSIERKWNIPQQDIMDFKEELKKEKVNEDAK